MSWLVQPNFKVNVNIRSINFHGLSPFGTPRSQEGCIRFVYTPIIDVGYVILQVCADLFHLGNKYLHAIVDSASAQGIN